jgi:MoxR-like ATPase
VKERHNVSGENAPGPTPDWPVYRGGGEPSAGIDGLPDPPPWRRFDGGSLVEADFGQAGAANRRRTAAAMSYRADAPVVDVVNAAIFLRRPLLVTGKPGAGKSTLAYSIAYELGLGPVLYWPITSRSKVGDGLYRYDALGRLHEANLSQYAAARRSGEHVANPDIGRYVHLGPLGSALLPRAKPRVLLIDELDKSDLDLPNDLLNIFEEGEFEIPELRRLPADQSVVEVMTADSDNRVPIHRGLVTCHAFPIVIITSNGEREFPAAFLRRCLWLDMQPPDRERLARIVAAQLGPETLARCGDLIDLFLARRTESDLATDQLLNAIYLATSGSSVGAESNEHVINAVLRPLGRAAP